MMTVTTRAIRAYWSAECSERVVRSADKSYIIPAMLGLKHGYRLFSLQPHRHHGLEIVGKHHLLHGLLIGHRIVLNQPDCRMFPRFSRRSFRSIAFRR